LTETPNPAVLANHKIAGIKLFYPETDIVEGAEAKGALYNSSI
jgi:hypothetical protein